MITRLATLFLLTLALFGQEGAVVNQTQGPPQKAYQKRFYRDGSGNVQYICTAPSRVYSTSLVVSGATNASPIVITTTANHGLVSDSQVTIASVAGNTAANGTWTVTVLSATTFSLNGSSGSGAYTSGGTVSTAAPRGTNTVWSIQKFYYTSTSLDVSAWAGGNTSMTFACDSRGTYSYQ